MDKKPLDLRSDEEESTPFEIPMNITIIITTILVLSGLFVGIVIPELTSEETKGTMGGHSDILDAICISTVNELESADQFYNDVSIPDAYYITITEDSNITGVDSIVNDYLIFMLGEEDGLELTISPGQGYPFEFQRKISVGETGGASSESTSTEVLVDIDAGGEEVRMEFTLRTWEGGSI